MKNYNFQAWLKQPLGDDPEVSLAGKLEYLRLYLTDAMREVRTQAGVTQAQLAEKLGVQQGAVSKLESAMKDHELESVLHYLHALGADLLVAVKQGGRIYQASDNDGLQLVDIPETVVEKAAAAEMNVRDYVHAAIAQFSPSIKHVNRAFLRLLEGDDPVAVKVRERLGGRTLQSIADELETCLSASEGEEQIFALRNVLANKLMVGGNCREEGNRNDDEIELLALAEDLLDKWTEIRDTN
jgi:transcriptional regulator with XRE-family HTH domain